MCRAAGITTSEVVFSVLRSGSRRADASVGDSAKSWQAASTMRTSTWAGGVAGCAALLSEVAPVLAMAVAVLSCRMILIEAICGNHTLPAATAASNWSASSKPLSLRAAGSWMYSESVPVRSRTVTGNQIRLPSLVRMLVPAGGSSTRTQLIARASPPLCQELPLL